MTLSTTQDVWSEAHPIPEAVRRQDHKNARQRDSVLGIVVWASIGLSILAYAWFAAQGTILTYKDAISHLEIARRVIDGPLTNPASHFAQLGAVWLPLPHLLALPFVWANALYFSGFAGSIASMAAFVLASVLLYKITYGLTKNKLAGLVSVGVFALNPNILYMQSTPMTELPLFALMAGMVYGVQRWIQTDRSRYLAIAGIFSSLATLTRYEAWVLLLVLTVIVMFAFWRKRQTYVQGEGGTIAFLFRASLGIILWLGWNILIMGNPFYFQFGEYAKPSLWVGKDEAAIGNAWVSLKTYYFAVTDNLSLVVLLLMLIGLIVFVAKERLSLATLPTLSLLVLFPFFVVALYLGQRPLHVLQVGGPLYNVRFGLLMILPASILIGYLVGVAHHKYATIAVTAVVGFTMGAIFVAGVALPDSIVTLKEPTDALKTGYTRTSDAASAYLKRHYDGGRILAESFGNELVLFDAGITPTENVYEGSFKLWKPALRDPAGNGIKWIVMRHTSQPDDVYTSLGDSGSLDGYTRVYANDTYYIYQETH